MCIAYLKKKKTHTHKEKQTKQKNKNKKETKKRCRLQGPPRPLAKAAGSCIRRELYQVVNIVAAKLEHGGCPILNLHSSRLPSGGPRASVPLSHIAGPACETLPFFLPSHLSSFISTFSPSCHPHFLRSFLPTFLLAHFLSSMRPSFAAPFRHRFLLLALPSFLLAPLFPSSSMKRRRARAQRLPSGSRGIRVGRQGRAPEEAWSASFPAAIT